MLSPLNPGGSIELADVQITLVQAFHNSGSLSPNLALGSVLEGHYFHPDGGSCGVILFFNGITDYNTSDTNAFSEMQLIGQMYGPQIAIMPVGGKFTMGIREAARAASFIRPDIVIPCHYGSEVGQLADIDELGRAVKFLSSNTNVAALASGQILEYTASNFSVEDEHGNNSMIT